jgi:hypothetical protein
MKNLRVYMPLANNDQLALEFASGRQLIDLVLTSGAVRSLARSCSRPAQRTDERFDL